MDLGACPRLVIPTTLISGLPLPTYLLTLGASSIALGMMSGLVAGKDLHYRLARKWRLTNRTGRVDTWQDVFQELPDNWIVVHTEDGKRAVGWAQFFSDAGDRPALFLRDARWVEDDGTSTPIAGPGLLVGEAARIKFIEFLGNGEEGE